MANTFKSNDIEISKMLKEISIGVSQLPDFQRGWVWDDNRIKALIVSIINSYPIGALMFLEYGGDSSRFKCRSFTGVVVNDKQPEFLVLDGQQRLTSVFSSMYCHDPVITRTEKNEEIKRFYYLDINHCLDSPLDRDEAIISIPEDKLIRSDFGRQISLDLSSTEKEFENHMFPLNIVYDVHATEEWLDDYRAYYNYDKMYLERLRIFRTEVLTVIQGYKIPVITLDKNTPKEAVCQVFENVNTGGVSLTVFELVTAIYATEDFDLRSDWNKRQNEFITKSMLTPNDAENAILYVVSATDFLTATTLYSRYLARISGGEAVSCKRKDVLKLSFEDYQKNASKISDGFIEAAKFLKEQRIFSLRDLPYSTQLIPMAVIFALLGNRIQDGITKNKIARWYWNGVLGEMYGGANETRYSNDVTEMMAWIHDDKNEPDTVRRAYFNPTRLLTLQTRQSAAYKGIMALILQKGAQDFINGRSMDFTIFLDENTDIHHIFPKAYCEKQGIEKNKWNSIVNKTPIFARTNRVIGGHAPSIYLSNIEKNGHIDAPQINQFVSSHLIDVSSMRDDDFNSFFIERSKSLLKLISEAMGKTISERESNEIISVFGANLNES